MQVHKRDNKALCASGDNTEGRERTSGQHLDGLYTLCLSQMQDPQEPFIMNYIILIGDSSFSNFQKVHHIQACEIEPHPYLDSGFERHPGGSSKQSS
jgi:hypothetical protein